MISRRISVVATSGMPDSLEMHLSSDFTIPHNLEPVVDSIANAQRRELYSELTNFVIASDILVVHFNGHIIRNLLHVDLKSLVKDWGLASTLLYSRFELLLKS